MRLRVIKLLESNWMDIAQELLVERMSTGEGKVSSCFCRVVLCLALALINLYLSQMFVI